MQVAYLVSHYPSLSHTFVMREVQALRARGTDVRTIAIRRPAPRDLLAPEDRDAAATTTYILPARIPRVLAAHARAALRPGAYAAALRRALERSTGAPRDLLWQLFYFVEAILLWDICRRDDIRHVHVHFANAAADTALLAGVYAEGSSHPLTWSFTMHGPWEFFRIDGMRLPEKVRSARFVACISDFCRSQLMGLSDPDDWSKLHVVHCGLDLARFAPGPREASATFSVLTVGRVVPVKGQLLLIAAIEQLRREGVDAKLTIVGDGPLLERIRDEIARRGLEAHIHAPGAVGQDRIPGLFHAADAFCLPSFAEGVPVVLMEAMALGVPVLATRLAGVPELIEDGRSGLLVRPGRLDELTAALSRLAREPDLRRRLAAQGRRAVQEGFDVHQSAALLANHFELAAA